MRLERFGRYRLIDSSSSSFRHSARCNGLGARSELVILVFEQDVERGERSVAARDVLLQVELVGIAQFVARVHLLLETTPPQPLQAFVMLYVIHVYNIRQQTHVGTSGGPRSGRAAHDRSQNLVARRFG